MTAVDSLDNIFMLSAYTIPQRSQTGFGDEKERREARWWDMRRWQLFERRKEEGEVDEDEAEDRARMLPMPDQDKLLSISVVLTVISIVVRSFSSPLVDIANSDCSLLIRRSPSLSVLPSSWVWHSRSALRALMRQRTIRDCVRSLPSSLSPAPFAY